MFELWLIHIHFSFGQILKHNNYNFFYANSKFVDLKWIFDWNSTIFFFLTFFSLSLYIYVYKYISSIYSFSVLFCITAVKIIAVVCDLMSSFIPCQLLICRFTHSISIILFWLTAFLLKRLIDFFLYFSIGSIFNWIKFE